MSKAKLALSFRIFQHGQFVREDTLALGVIKIGKVPSAHLRIDDDSISRMHAVLEVNDHEVSLIDLGSTRGTFVNGKKINKAKLASGDVLQLGDVRVELAISAAAGAAAVVATRSAASAAAVVAIRSAGASSSSASASSLASGATIHAAPAGALSARDPLATTSGTIAPARAAGQPALALHSVLVSDAVPPRPPTAARPPALPLRAVPSSTPAPPLARPEALRAPLARPEALRAPLAHPLASVAHPAAAQRVIAEAAEELGGARAIEVAAMLGDSVIGVKHCIDPRGGVVRPATWGLFAAGVGFLIASTLAFVASVRNSADNTVQRDTWTRVQHRPVSAFRPHQLGAGVDWLAFGGLALGLAGVTLGLWRMRGERTSPYYRIGTAPGVEQAVEHAPLPAFPLVAPAGDDFVFNYGAGIDGELIVDGHATPLAELAAAGRSRPSASTAGAIEVPIPPRARIRARSGQTTFMITAVARPRRHVAPLLAHFESRALSYAAGSLAVHLGIWALLQLVPPDMETVNVDPPGSEDVTMRSAHAAQTEPTPEPERDLGDGAGSGASLPAAAMALPTGASGNPDAAHADGHLQIAQRDSLPPMTREQAIEQARTAGPLGSTQLIESIRFIGATGDYESGFDTSSTNGAIDGPGNEGQGSFGAGIRGTGPGRGCLGGPCGTIGLPGGYGKIGIGPSALGFRLGGHDGIALRGHPSAVPQVGQPVIATSNYDKSIVRRYIRRHLNEITYCYEKQLLAHPALGGDVKISFFISPTGVVQSSSGEGFDPEVTSCLASVIKTIEFPAPGEGGGVQVNYPFHFHAPAT